MHGGLRPERVGWGDLGVAAAFRLGLSQVMFARRFGFSVDAIRHYEQGHRVAVTGFWFGWHSLNKITRNSHGDGVVIGIGIGR